nr:hypothetical protein [Pantoea sp. 18069]
MQARAVAFRVFHLRNEAGRADRRLRTEHHAAGVHGLSQGVPNIGHIEVEVNA